MIPAIPIVIVLLGAGAYLRRDKNRGVMTPDRIKIFNAALAGGIQDPANLDKLANTFGKEGLDEQANLLRQRAALKRLPNEVKLARREIWRKAIASKDRELMMRIAAAYDSQGCTSAAMRLREIASGLPEQIPETASESSGETAASSESPPEETPDETVSTPDKQAAE